MVDSLDRTWSVVERAQASAHAVDVSWLGESTSDNDWPLAADALRFMTALVFEAQPRHILELGSGVSTRALARAARAYEGLLPLPKPGETYEERVREHSKKYIGRGEPGASEIMANLFDADYLMKNELVFIGSPDTVAKKIHAAAEAGMFNVFLGEFNFADLQEADLMRSIRLFGEKVMPALRGYEPF